MLGASFSLTFLPLPFRGPLQLLQFRNNLRGVQPIPELHIKKIPSDYSAFIDEISRGPRDLPIARVEDVISSNRLFRLVGEQRIGYLECLPR